MKWMNKLEQKFGKYAISNLMFYIIVLYAIGFVFDLFIPNFYEYYLSLNMEAILHGQVWRVVTFLIQPPNANPLFMVFALYLYYMIGKQLEYSWGTFRFNLYFFTGVLFHVLGALLAYVLTYVFTGVGISLPLGTFYLNLSLFFAFAAMYPNEEFMLFFILPIKVKYLAWLDAAFFAYTIVQAFLPAYGGKPIIGVIYKANALEAFVSILNFLIFWLATRNVRRFSPKEMRRKSHYRQAVKKEQENFRSADGARHRCCVCGRTELTNPELEFRYCSKCNGAHEYCQDHLFTHEHVK